MRDDLEDDMGWFDRINVRTHDMLSAIDADSFSLLHTRAKNHLIRTALVDLISAQNLPVSTASTVLEQMSEGDLEALHGMLKFEFESKEVVDFYAKKIKAALR